jgi:hypothetical protein
VRNFNWLLFTPSDRLLRSFRLVDRYKPYVSGSIYPSSVDQKLSDT